VGRRKRFSLDSDPREEGAGVKKWKILNLVITGGPVGKGVNGLQEVSFLGRKGEPRSFLQSGLGAFERVTVVKE